MTWLGSRGWGPATETDIFFSGDDGLAETGHVFLAGNNLPGAWTGRDRFVVSELGFGTGLNALALALLISKESTRGQQVPRLLYQSVEISPRPVTEYRLLAERWPELTPFARELEAQGDPHPGWNRWALSWGDLTLYHGDAADLPILDPSFEAADAWFLDGWAPAKHAQLWTPELLAWVGRHTVPGGTAATYTAAGVVKQGLRAAGFDVSRRPGWGQKRHMIHAIRKC